LAAQANAMAFTVNHRAAWICAAACGSAHAQAARHTLDLAPADDFNGDA
jgi:hypothetical protein